MSDLRSKLKQLRQQRADLSAQMRSLIDACDPAKGLSDEQKQSFDGLKAQAARIDESIVIAEAMAEEERTAPVRPDPNEEAERAARERQNDAARFQSFGEQMQAVAAAAVNGVRDQRLSWHAAPTGMGESVAADGGFLVQTDFSSELWRRTYETGQLTSRVRRIPISATANGLKMNAIKESSRADGSRWGGVQAYWAGENDQFTASRPKFRQIELDLKKLTGLAYATEELLQDATALGTVLQMAFAEEFGFKLDHGIMRGTGAGMPLGYLDHPATVVVPEHTSGSPEEAQEAGTVLVENVTAMWSRMWARSRGNAVWLINQQVEPQLMTMKIGDTPIYVPQGGFANAPFAALLGRPIIPVEQAAALGSKGDVQFVDLSQYIMIEKGGIQAAESIHVRFIQDEMTFRFILRADGQPAWDTALTPYAGGDTLSWAVVLGERDGNA